MLNDKEVVEFCEKNGIVFQAYSSMGTSDKSLSKNLLDNEVIISLSKKYAKSPAQILLKWSIQQNIGIFKFNFFFNTQGPAINILIL